MPSPHRYEGGETPLPRLNCLHDTQIRRCFMPDLRDGESFEMQGSGSKPYTLKNVGGVYSCSCPAWRNQSAPIERRTCKHLRRLRGDAEEEARLGGALPVKAKAAKTDDEGDA